MKNRYMCTSYTVLAKICKSVLHSNFNERGKKSNINSHNFNPNHLVAKLHENRFETKQDSN